MIKAIIFDLGNVLVSFDHRIAAKKILSSCAKSEDEIYKFFFDSPLTAAFEEGNISALDFFIEVKKELSLNLDYADFLPIWNEIFFFTQANNEVYSLAKDLSRRYRVALLSNINELHFDYLQKRFPVFDAFHDLLLSFQLKAKKPDEKIYRKALDALSASADEVFYTDDRPELIESSRKLGMHGFVFQGVERLKGDLMCKGINIF